MVRRFPLGRAPQICILLASLVFYAWPKPANLPYLLGSILGNWLLARWIASATGLARKRILQLSLVLNLAFLCAFKYLDFIAETLNGVFGRHLPLPGLAFPLGISFFTLTQIMYLVDCYEQLVPANTLFDHATFVSFFPYVISGPLSRAKRILHQFPVLNAREGPAAELVARALYLFSLGLVKKVVLADAFSRVADYGWASIASWSALEAWVVVTSYALQIYFDFSGYSDMAIASALLFGIDIPRNFDAPLRAKSIIEYWQRWHISLTSFITTYLYTPIMQSFRRITLATSAVATIAAMTIAGLWHGPNWTYVLFGTVHGAGLAINQVWRRKKMPALPGFLSWLLTFAVYDVGFAFFRSPDVTSAFKILGRMFNWHDPFGTFLFLGMNGRGPMLVIYLAAQACGICAAFLGKSTDQLARDFKPTWPSYAAAVACALLAFLYLNSNVVTPFVYAGF